MSQTLYLHIPELLLREDLDQIRTLTENAVYLDGKLTAYDAAREVKDNLQLNTQSQEYIALQQLILHAINRNSFFRHAVLPKQVHPFLISKYGPGMQYGWHVDSPIMGNMMRTDVAMTIFLTNPEDYSGGELELRTALGDVQFKLKQGDAICYPCTHIHRVKEVTSGMRHVAVTWIESMVKVAEQRNMLFELYKVTEKLREKNLEQEEYHILQQHYSNLLRLWAE